MSFDSLTIFGIFASMLGGGFVLSTVFRTDTADRARSPRIGHPERQRIGEAGPRHEASTIRERTTAVASAGP